MTAFQVNGVKAWDAFTETRRDRPYPIPQAPEDGESGAKRQAFERRYLRRIDAHRSRGE